MRKILAGMAACVMMVSSLWTGATVTQAAGYHEYDVEKYIMQELSAASIPGVSVSIVSDQKEVYSATFGVDGKTEADYVLGNLTHSITALGVLQLAEDGEVALEDDITTYLPKYSQLSGVTVEQLLHQTSGISVKENSDAVKKSGVQDTFEASNLNYTILGELIETLSKETYEEYITENVLDPCEMGSTYSLRQNPELQDQISPAYRNLFGYPVPENYSYDEKDPWTAVSSGYLLSDVKDMGKYLQMYLKEGNKDIEPENIAAVLQNTVPMPDNSRNAGLFGTTESYGMGWIATEYKGEELYYQSGMLAHQMATMILIPQKKVGVVLLFNDGDYLVGKGMMEKVSVGVTDILLGEQPAKIDSKDYLLQHGVIDAILLVALLGACMPIFLTGVWKKRARRGFRVVRLIKDILIQLVLPTCILVLIPIYVYPWSLLYQVLPDVTMVFYGIIAALYVGAVLKLLQSIGLVIRYKIDPDSFAEEDFEPGDLMELDLDMAINQAEEKEKKTETDAQDSAKEDTKTETQDAAKVAENTEAQTQDAAKVAENTKAQTQDAAKAADNTEAQTQDAAKAADNTEVQTQDAAKTAENIEAQDVAKAADNTETQTQPETKVDEVQNKEQ